jgi:hypothetical protein
LYSEPLATRPQQEITLHRQTDALRAAKGAWKAEDHPELVDGAAERIREIPQESAKRYEKIERHRKAG